MTFETAQAIDKELERLGIKDGVLPKALLAEFGTGEPAELNETEGLEAVAMLKKMK
jgi:metal-dependent amidase/aminoacylase/carboxypeptidase family protein